MKHFAILLIVCAGCATQRTELPPLPPGLTEAPSDSMVTPRAPVGGSWPQHSVAWTASADPVDGYRVYWTDDLLTPLQPIGETNGTSYPLPRTERGFVGVRAFRGTLESEWATP